uniref:Uncharacterized protein n=1 Tax=Parascaris equorum TaxID=6256 RepID=A0A914S0V0_PAREQ
IKIFSHFFYPFLGDNKKQGGNPPATGARPTADALKPSIPATPAAAAPPPPVADPVDEGGDNYEDVNIGGGEPPPA